MFYSCEKSISRKKTSSSHWEISLSCTTQKYDNDTDNTFLSLEFLLSYLSSVCLQKFKMKENFKLLALKVVTVAYSDLTG